MLKVAIALFVLASINVYHPFIGTGLGPWNPARIPSSAYAGTQKLFAGPYTMSIPAGYERVNPAGYVWKRSDGLARIELSYGTKSAQTTSVSIISEHAAPPSGSYYARQENSTITHPAINGFNFTRGEVVGRIVYLALDRENKLDIQFEYTPDHPELMHEFESSILSIARVDPSPRPQVAATPVRRPPAYTPPGRMPSQLEIKQQAAAIVADVYGKHAPLSPPEAGPAAPDNQPAAVAASGAPRVISLTSDNHAPAPASAQPVPARAPTSPAPSELPPKPDPALVDRLNALHARITSNAGGVSVMVTEQPDRVIAMIADQRVVSLYVSGTLNAESWKRVAAFPKLQSLLIVGGSTTDEDINVLSEHAWLHRLQLRGCTELTDKCFKTLSSCRNLTDLNMEGDAKITGEGIGALAKCPKLHLLNLKNTHVGDHIFDLLKTMPIVAVVTLTDTRVDPDLLRQFAISHPKILITP